MGKLIDHDISIIPACDFCSIQKYINLIKETASIPEIGAYKIGAALGLTHGLPTLTNIAHKYSNKPLIYDHQKAGTDIPDTGHQFMKMLSDSGIDAVIIFPLSGPVTEAAWIEAALRSNISVICGGYMTHKSFIHSEGGFIADEAIEIMYSTAAAMGINDFVVPGNKPEIIKKIGGYLKKQNIQPTFYSPGFITQGGTLSETAKVAGSNWHAIIGRAIYEANDIEMTVSDIVANLKHSINSSNN